MSPSLFLEMLEENHHNYHYDHCCTGKANGQSQEVELREAYGVHNSEPELPCCHINIRWVLHLAGVCPIIINLQLLKDGDITLLRAPIPYHPLLETPTHVFEGIHMVVENK